MSCRKVPSRSPSTSFTDRAARAATGSSASAGGSRSSPATPATASSRCTSTVNRWYGSRWGRHRTASHSGRKRVSSPTRSMASRVATARSPVRSSRRNASRTPADHGTSCGSGMPSTASRNAADSGALPSASAANAAMTSSGASSRTSAASSSRPRRSSRSNTASRTCSTCRACSNVARMSPSTAGRPGSSSNPSAPASDGWKSRWTRSVFFPDSRCSALRSRTRNSSAASRASRSDRRSHSCASSSRSVPSWPTAISPHRTEWMSRSPPAPSFTSGSSRWETDPNFARRAFAASRSFAMNAGSERTSARTRSRIRPNSSASPASRRASSSAVAASRRSAASRRQSRTVRTACPTVKPASHSG